MVATGFFFKLGSVNYLVTCWHAVTGYDFKSLEVMMPPYRRFVRVTCKDVKATEGTTSIADAYTWVQPLYANDMAPAWMQEGLSRPHPDLAEIGLSVPLQIDAVALRVDLDETKSRFLSLTSANYASSSPLRGGEDMLIVGYPYGYSALGVASPEPIFVKRAIAAEVTERPLELLLDGVGARGMSGSPVFRKEGNVYTFVGMYTGAVHPDYSFNTAQARHDIYSSLGTLVTKTGLQLIGLL